MAQNVMIYAGDMINRDNIPWRAEIWTEMTDDALVPEPGDLEFDADDGLVIEWNAAAKTDVLCGSRATLTVISPGDRTYESLYIIKPGTVWLRVYRDRSLYWSGALDPEFYEEPYERDSDYCVTLVFSDFGILDRLPYDMFGMRTVGDIMQQALSRARIWPVFDQSLISTQLAPGSGPLSLCNISVRSDNFYDEDGVASSMKDVLKGMLQPLGLKMMQRDGRVYIYDLNGLYNLGDVSPVEWNSDSSSMGTDVVYNNVKITWSPYTQSGTLTDDECWAADTETDTNTIAPQQSGGYEVGDARIWSYPISPDPDDLAAMGNPAIGDYGAIGFTLWTTKMVKGVELIAPALRGYKISPQYSGQEDAGIVIHWPEVWIDHSLRLPPVQALRYYKRGRDLIGLSTPDANWSDRLFRSERIQVPHVTRGSDLAIRIAIDLRMDPRVNPYEDIATWPKGRWNTENTPAYEISHVNWMPDWDRHGRLVYVPVSVYFRPNDGNDLYCWTNRPAVEGTHTRIGMADSMGEWRRVADGDEYGYLCYYSKTDRKTKAAVTAGCTNRQAIPPIVTCKESRNISDADDGQYIAYPNMGSGGGELWVEVHGSGWLLRDGGWDLRPTQVNDFGKLWQRLCWITMGVPAIEIINNKPFGQEIDTDDVEYSAEVNSDARESLELDTVCGTAADGIPTARGVYFDVSTGEQITELTRAGRTAQAEELLIGTVYSQHAGRMTTLSGEMQLLAGGVCAYKEINQQGKLFMVTADVQNVAANTSDATIVELRPDEYDKRK